MLENALFCNVKKKTCHAIVGGTQTNCLILFALLARCGNGGRCSRGQDGTKARNLYAGLDSDLSFEKQVKEVQSRFYQLTSISNISARLIAVLKCFCSRVNHEKHF